MISQELIGAVKFIATDMNKFEFEHNPLAPSIWPEEPLLGE